MSFETSSTLSINGVELTLSVRVLDEGLRNIYGVQPLFSVSEEPPADLLPHILPVMPRALSQAHDLISENLLRASVDLIESSINATPKEQSA